MDPTPNNQYYPVNSNDTPATQPFYSFNPPIQPGYPQQNSAQYPQYPQYSSYPPYSQQQYPPQQFPQEPNYLPPNQYAVIPNQDLQQNSARAETNRKIQDLERRLNQGWFKCYVIWLYFLAFMGLLDLIQSFIGAVTYSIFGYYIPSFICALWLIYQSLLEVSAIQRRNLRLAQIALIRMWIYGAFNLIAIIVFATIVGNPCNDYNCTWDSFDFVQSYVTLVLVLYSISLLIHLCVTIVGAVHVRRVLRERKALQDSLRTIY